MFVSFSLRFTPLSVYSSIINRRLCRVIQYNVLFLLLLDSALTLNNGYSVDGDGDDDDDGDQVTGRAGDEEEAFSVLH